MICPHCGFEQPDASVCARCDRTVAAGPAPLVPGGAAAAVAPPMPPIPPAPDVYAPPMPPPMPSARPADRPLGTFTSGAVIAETFAVYFRNFLPFLIISAVALVPRMLVSAAAIGLGSEGAAKDSFAVGGLAFLALLTQTLGVQFASGAATYGVLQDMRGREVTVAGCLRVGRSAFWSIFAVGLISGLLVGLASLLCLVPGIILAVRWAVAVPVTVEEQPPGAQRAMERSSELTEGYRWPVFGVYFLVILINIGLAVALTLALSGTAIGQAVAEVGAALLTTGLAASSAAVMYYRLRSVKESIDVREIASVFD